jgi:hypothetical protein
VCLRLVRVEGVIGSKAGVGRRVTLYGTCEDDGGFWDVIFTRHCGMCKALLDCWLRPHFGSVGLGGSLDFAMRAYEIANL